MLRRLAVAVAAVVVLAHAASATTIPVDDPYLVGSRSTPDSSGVTAADGWTQANGGFKISWDISYSMADMLWDYSYWITDADGSALQPELSHWLLQVSEVITPQNVEQYILNADFTWENDQPKLFTADPNSPNSTNPGANGGSPNLPVDLYAIKIDDGQSAVSFQSPQQPVWGSFYVKDGKQDGIVATAWNVVTNVAPSAPFTNWIPTPDTNGGSGGHPTIPEPGTVLLLGWGLAGLVALKRRRRCS